MEHLTVTRHELLQVADAVAREKSIERDEVLEAMEQAIQKAGRAKYGHEHDIRAVIDRKTGEIKLAPIARLPTRSRTNSPRSRRNRPPTATPR